MPAVFALLQSPAKIEGAEHIFGKVYLITAKPLFEQTISARPDPDTFHVYLGYAGWTNDQLKKEVELGAWFIFPADASTVFNVDPDSVWQQMIRKTELKWAGGEFADPPWMRAGPLVEVSSKAMDLGSRRPSRHRPDARVDRCLKTGLLSGFVRPLTSNFFSFAPSPPTCGGLQLTLSSVRR